ncbi:hypothetical protein [Deinococcus pimensis]|uniref:hypothetical protein n=1 Tax=Deinococcus pimensis TaxID=309888 RepID=UPI0004832963|nr:hypothetical protein [Deinococcus pimensis]
MSSIHHFTRAPRAVSLVLLLAASTPSAASAQTLVNGTPPLTERTVQDFTTYTAWAYDTPLTDTQKRRLRAGLIRAWQGQDEDTIRYVLGGVKNVPGLRGMNDHERAYAWYEYALPQLEEVRALARQDALAAWFYSLYEDTHPALAPGHPPLTRKVTDATADLFAFMINRVLGRDVITFDAAERNAWADSLTRNYASLGEKQTQVIVLAKYWAALRGAWATLPAARKNKVLNDWSDVVRSLLPAQTLAYVKGDIQTPPSGGHMSDADFSRLQANIASNDASFQRLRRLGLEQHVVSLNIMQNISNSGSQWKLCPAGQWTC